MTVETTDSSIESLPAEGEVTAQPQEVTEAPRPNPRRP
jgi:hypothetical protein